MGARSNSPDDWRSSREKCGGGFLIMIVCHAIDYMYYITGLKGTPRLLRVHRPPPRPATSRTRSASPAGGANARVGSVAGSSIMRGREWREERILGTKGTMVLNGQGLTMYSTRPIDGKTPGRVHHYHKFPDVSWTAEWVRAFVTAIREGREPEISAREGWENLAFITAAYRSMEEGRAIDVPACSEDLVLAMTAAERRRRWTWHERMCRRSPPAVSAVLVALGPGGAGAGRSRGGHRRTSHGRGWPRSRPRGTARSRFCSSPENRGLRRLVSRHSSRPDPQTRRATLGGPAEPAARRRGRGTERRARHASICCWRRCRRSSRLMLAGHARERLTIDYYLNVHIEGPATPLGRSSTATTRVPATSPSQNASSACLRGRAVAAACRAALAADNALHRAVINVLHLRDTDRVCGPGKTIIETACAADGRFLPQDRPLPARPGDDEPLLRCRRRARRRSASRSARHTSSIRGSSARSSGSSRTTGSTSFIRTIQVRPARVGGRPPAPHSGHDDDPRLDPQQREAEALHQSRAVGAAAGSSGVVAVSDETRAAVVAVRRARAQGRGHSQRRSSPRTIGRTNHAPGFIRRQFGIAGRRRRSSGTSGA